MYHDNIEVKFDIGYNQVNFDRIILLGRWNFRLFAVSVQYLCRCLILFAVFIQFIYRCFKRKGEGVIKVLQTSLRWPYAYQKHWYFSNIAIFLVICLAAKLYIMWTLNVTIYTLNSRAITILIFYYYSFFLGMFPLHVKYLCIEENPVLEAFY